MNWLGRKANRGQKPSGRITAAADDPALADTAPAAAERDPSPVNVKAPRPQIHEPAAIAIPDNEDALPSAIRERFDNLTFLGRGGMGTVYRGFDKQLARDVAIKFVHSQDAARFLREARAQARITHDNVCKIFDVNVADGSVWNGSLGVVMNRLAHWGTTCGGT